MNLQLFSLLILFITAALFVGSSVCEPKETYAEQCVPYTFSFASVPDLVGNARQCFPGELTAQLGPFLLPEEFCSSTLNPATYVGVTGPDFSEGHSFTMLSIASGVQYPQQQLDAYCPKIIADAKFDCFKSVDWDLLITTLAQDTDISVMNGEDFDTAQARIAAKEGNINADESGFMCRGIACYLMEAVHAGAKALLPGRRRMLEQVTDFGKDVKIEKRNLAGDYDLSNCIFNGVPCSLFEDIVETALSMYITADTQTALGQIGFGSSDILPFVLNSQGNSVTMPDFTTAVSNTFAPQFYVECNGDATCIGGKIFQDPTALGVLGQLGTIETQLTGTNDNLGNGTTLTDVVGLVMLQHCMGGNNLMCKLVIGGGCAGGANPTYCALYNMILSDEAGDLVVREYSANPLAWMTGLSVSNVEDFVGSENRLRGACGVPLRTAMPTLFPTFAPTLAPTYAPTTMNPTLNPTNNPTLNPTLNPINNPTNNPTLNPTNNPTFTPSIENLETFAPTQVPTEEYETTHEPETGTPTITSLPDFGDKCFFPSMV